MQKLLRLTGQMFLIFFVFSADVFTTAAFVCRTVVQCYACYPVTSMSGNNGISALDEEVIISVAVALSC